MIQPRASYFLCSLAQPRPWICPSSETVLDHSPGQIFPRSWLRGFRPPSSTSHGSEGSGDRPRPAALPDRQMISPSTEFISNLSNHISNLSSQNRQNTKTRRTNCIFSAAKVKRNISKDFGLAILYQRVTRLLSPLGGGRYRPVSR